MVGKFVHLHTHTHYSLLDGMTRIPELVEKVKLLGMDSVAITDHGNVYGAIEFYKACKAAEIKPILGVEAYIAPGDHKNKGRSDLSRNPDATPSNGGRDYYHLTLLAENETGWKNILKLVTKSHLDGYYYRPRMDKQLLAEHHEGIIALSGCLSGEMAQYLMKNDSAGAEKAVKEYQNIFGKENFFIELGLHEAVPLTVDVTPKMAALANKLNIPMVATQDSHYLNSEDRETHDILLCIQTGSNMDDKDRFHLEDDFSLLSPEAMEKRYQDYPDATLNTVKIAERCNVTIELGKILLPKYETPDGLPSQKHLEKLVKSRTNDRYPSTGLPAGQTGLPVRQAGSPQADEVTKRIDYELSVIEKMGFADYFLIVADFINWAKDRGVVVGPGRGSAAGSIVSYILGITNLDPLHYGLLFERFLNPSRIQMPDIDIDITDIRRDEVFGYLQEKYGDDHVAHIITFGTMAARASVRDVGRALGIEYSFCDRLAKMIPFMKDLNQAMELVPELKEIYKADGRAKKIIDSARRLEGVARHASVHACGTVIAADPLVNRVPLQRSPQKENVIITQFEMHAIEDLGLLKMDILGLKNLTIIEETIRTIGSLTGESVNIDTIPLDDKKTFNLLQKADTTGVFQLESGGMRRYLKQLKPTELEDIIAMVALYRPGPMELIPSYISRKHGEEQVTYLHPKLEPVLRTTYGIGIYQEQMMKIASDLAGYSLAEADTLRKAIGKKIKKLLDEQEKKLIAGMIKNGIPERTAKAIWELFPPFARYGFNRSHAACYAMIAYQTAFLKANYPEAFMTALMNADRGDVERIAFLIQEAKKMNILVLPPDINKSSASFTPEGPNIRFGLTAIKNVGDNIIAAIIEERARSGEFENFPSLLTRVIHKDLNKKSLESLIKCGALDSFGLERNLLLSNMDEILKFAQVAKKGTGGGQTGLFGALPAASARSLKLTPSAAATKEQKLAWEKELLGLYVSDHPLNTKRDQVNGTRPTPIKEMLRERSASKGYRIAGMVASVKKILTKTGKPMVFAKVEDLTDSVEVVVFNDLFAKTESVWQDGAVVVVTGRLNARNGNLALVAEQAKSL